MMDSENKPLVSDKLHEKSTWCLTEQPPKPVFAQISTQGQCLFPSHTSPFVNAIASFLPDDYLRTSITQYSESKSFSLGDFPSSTKSCIIRPSKFNNIRSPGSSVNDDNVLKTSQMFSVPILRNSTSVQSAFDDAPVDCTSLQREVQINAFTFIGTSKNVTHSQRLCGKIDKLKKGSCKRQREVGFKLKKFFKRQRGFGSSRNSIKRKLRNIKIG